MDSALATLLIYTCIHITVGVGLGYGMWDKKTGLPEIRMSASIGVVISLLVAGISFVLSVAFDNVSIFLLVGLMSVALILTNLYNNNPKVIADRKAAIARDLQEKQAEQAAKEQAELLATIEAMRPVAPVAGVTPQLSEAATQLATELDRILKK